MKNLWLEWWYLIIPGTFFIGILSKIVIEKFVTKIKSYFSTKVTIVKKYWKFIIPFLLANLVIYLIILFEADPENSEKYLLIMGQASTLIFAIFVGNYAFTQVVESRLERVLERGTRNCRTCSYKRAISFFEEAFCIDPNDYDTLANLLEFYLMNKDYKKFDEKEYLLDKLKMENRESVECYYLKIARQLFDENLREAKQLIVELVKFVKERPDSLDHFIWDFNDIKVTGAYKGLSGDQKKIFDNTVSYIQNKLTPEKKEKFEKGSYSEI